MPVQGLNRKLTLHVEGPSQEAVREAMGVLQAQIDQGLGFAKLEHGVKAQLVHVDDIWAHELDAVATDCDG